METKLIIACCAFSFIIGAYTAVLIEKDRGCTVSYQHGREIHVMIGSK